MKRRGRLHVDHDEALIVNGKEARRQPSKGP